jgi:hypothetical protein
MIHVTCGRCGCLRKRNCNCRYACVYVATVNIISKRHI